MKVKAVAAMLAAGALAWKWLAAAGLTVTCAVPVVTLDTGFALLPSAELAIYADRSRLASCRSKRPR